MKLVTYETAKLAKEKGFDPRTLGSKYACDFMFSENKEEIRIGSNEWWELSTKLTYHAPYQSQLQKWLREEHKIHVNPIFTSAGSSPKYGVELMQEVEKVVNYVGFGFKHPFTKSYEDALEAGLQEALNLIKDE